MKIKFTLIRVCLLWVVLLSALPAVVQAQDAYSTNADGSIYTYSTNADGSANIVAYAGPPWVVTIPTNINGLTVTTIGNQAFDGNHGLTNASDGGISPTNLTSVTIPNSITYIGVSAFSSCSSLTNVTIGNSVTTIGSSAFSSCTKLASIIIPNSVTSISNAAFSSCTSLTNVTIGNSVTSIGTYAFHGCTKLAIIIIPNSVTTIGSSAFSSCTNLISVYFTGNAPFRTNDSSVFSGYPNDDPATIYYLPGTTGWGAMFDGLPTVPETSQMEFNYTTNNGAITITGYTGSGSAVTIPATINGLTVTSIGGYAFYDCTFLTSATIPNSVTSIGTYAFYGCTSLTSVTIPNSVTSIGDNAFAYCTSLTSATIPNSVTSIGTFAFYGCTSLTSVTIPNSVTSIGDNAFAYCTSLTSVTIPNSVTSIGTYAFLGCTSLTSVTIPNSVTNIGSYAFDESSSLTGVYFTGNAPSPTNDSTVFSGDPATVYYLPGTTGWGAMFDGRPTVPETSQMEFNYTTNNGAITITGYTGSGSAVTIPATINGLTITSIGQKAFYDCTSLTSVTIPNSVTSIGTFAFYGCTSLTSVIIPNSVTSIGTFAFHGCTSLTSVIIPNSVTSIGTYAFLGCTSLTNVTIPNSVTNIGSYAFDESSSLTGVYFTGNAPSPTNDSTVFSGSPNGDPATVYYLPGTTGWGAMFDGRPTALWRPQAQTRDASFGVRTNQFGFNINWASGQSVVVEAATNLTNPVWQPVQTNTITSGSAYFSDPQWTNYPGRFYRLRSP